MTRWTTSLNPSRHSSTTTPRRPTTGRVLTTRRTPTTCTTCSPTWSCSTTSDGLTAAFHSLSFGYISREWQTTRNVYWSCASVCVCVSVRRRIPTLLHGSGRNLGEWKGCPLVVQCWLDLQSMHGFRCYDNIAPNAICQRVLVLALCLVKPVDMFELTGRVAKRQWAWLCSSLSHRLCCCLAV